MNSNITEILHKIRDMKEEDTETILRFIRENGYDKVESMKILMELKGISLSKAKEIVHLSKAWNDVMQRDNKFHEKLADIADDIQNES